MPGMTSKKGDQRAGGADRQLRREQLQLRKHVIEAAYLEQRDRLLFALQSGGYAAQRAQVKPSSADNRSQQALATSGTPNPAAGRQGPGGRTYAEDGESVLAELQALWEALQTHLASLFGGGNADLADGDLGPSPDPNITPQPTTDDLSAGGGGGPGPQPVVTPAPVVTPDPVVAPQPVVTPEPDPEPVVAVDQDVQRDGTPDTKKKDEQVTPPAPLPPMLDPTRNPDPTNEYAPNATYKKVEGMVAAQGRGDAHAFSDNDVKQGSIGNCYFVAQLAAQARAKPETLEKLIADNGDGTYTVTLHIKDKHRPWERNPTQVVVNSEFPHKGGKLAYAKTGDEGASGPELWVMLFEKAFAKVVGNYEETRGSKTPDGDVFAMLTGKRSRYIRLSSIGGSALLSQLEQAIANEQPVSFGAHSTRTLDEDGQKAAKDAGVVLNHAYSLKSVDKQKRTISLRNPWGVKHLDDMDVEVIQRFFSGVDIGAA